MKKNIKSDFVQLIRNHIDKLKNEFEPGELAYYGLTSKTETFIRDRLAFSLQVESAHKWLIGREWGGRVDLAILDPTRKPLLLVEAKAMHASGAWDGEEYYGKDRILLDNEIVSREKQGKYQSPLGQVAKDLLRRTRSFSDDEPEIYGLLLAFCPLGPVKETGRQPAIFGKSYARHHNDHWDRLKHKLPKEAHQKIIDDLEKEERVFPELRLLDSDQIFADRHTDWRLSPLNMPVCISWWLMKLDGSVS